MNKVITILFLCLLAETGFSQNSNPYSNTDKGQVYILWGWNRAYYTKSNISFKGDDYKFELAKVKKKNPLLSLARDFCCKRRKPSL